MLPEPYLFIDSRQRRIHKKLALIGLGTPAFFRDACRIMDQQLSIETKTHLVAHLLREIEGSVRAVLLATAEVSTGKSVKKDSKQGQQSEIRFILDAFQLPVDSGVGTLWLELASSENTLGLAKQAHRDALNFPRPSDEIFQDFWNRIQFIFDGLLTAFENRFLNAYSLLDELLKKAEPNADDIKTLQNRVPNNLPTLLYFFDRLESSGWVKPLRENKFFERPPGLIYDTDQENSYYPFWPLARYLMKVVQQVPEEAFEIINSVETDNPRIHQEFVKATLELPLDLAVKLLPKVTGWFQTSDPHFLFETLTKFAERLWVGGYVNPAFELCRTLFSLNNPDNKPSNESAYRKLEARVGEWHYRRALDELLPKLGSIAWDQALSLVLELLEQALHESGTDSEYSMIWRPAIENHEQNMTISHLKNMLISSVRDTAESLARADMTRVPQIITMLEARPGILFTRLSFDFLRRVANSAPQEIADRLTRREWFDAHELRHEYALLLRSNFPLLEPTQREIILGWIEAGPELEQWTEHAEASENEPQSQEKIQSRIEYWQLQHLAIISDSLEGSWRECYDQLTNKYGEPEHPEFVSYMSTFIGSKSPKSAHELGAMSIEQLLEYLSNWQPSNSNGFGEPSSEGLQMSLNGAVAAAPENFALNAEQFATLAPTYVGALLEGLRTAAEKDAVFEWLAVLKLCAHAVVRPIEAEVDAAARLENNLDTDSGWRGVRSAIANLLERAAFHVRPTELAITHRELVWSILEPLTNDLEPTPQYEARYGGSNMDPVTLSLNTVRGQAMHAVINYALWVRRHLKELPDAEVRLQNGLDEMPEVRNVLEARLDPFQEASVAVRSVFGQYFPYLVLLDEKWVITNLERIFPIDHPTLRCAVWQSYLGYSDVYNQPFKILSNEYFRAIDEINQSVSDESRHRNVAELLGQHLMLQYSRGEIILEGENLVKKFFECANVELRAKAISFVGRSIYRESNSDSDILERFQTLWTFRLKTALDSNDPGVFSKELAAFGWWFTSKQFENGWALDQLEQVLRITNGVVEGHEVTEHLAQLASFYPDKVIACFEMIVEGNTGGWSAYTWQDHVRPIVTIAINDTNQAVKERASSLVHRLGAMGFTEFRDLLL
jgi:hypothetical protein